MEPLAVIAPDYLAALRRQYRAEMVLVLVQLEQVVPGWWLTIEELAEQLGTDRSTLSRSIRKLERLGLIRRASYSNCGGTWIWWVQRSATDQPAPDAEPAWVARDVKRRLTERIPISSRWQWAAKHGIPRGTMSSWLYGYQRLLRDRWEIVESPHDD
jgi:DNA-binding HxlR family transcriptional regulator